MSVRNFLNQVKYQSFVLFHPFKGFYELKYEKKGSTASALFFLFFYFMSVVFKESCSSYLYQSRTNADFSVFLCLLRAAAPLLLFCIANWCLTLLLNGEGKMQQIFVALCYAVFPMFIYNILYTLLSNVFSMDEALYLSLIHIICIAWTAFLVLIAVMQTNQYTFLRSVASCLLSVVGIAIILLVFLLCADLIGQVVSFIVSIVRELSYR